MDQNQSEQVGSDSDNRPKTSFFKKNKWIIISVLCVLILGNSGYFGYQIYQTNQYVEKVSPIYRNCEAQGMQLTAMINNGGMYKTLIADTEKIAGQLKDLKVRLAEINTPTSKSDVVNGDIIKLIDIQIKRAQEQNSMYVHGLNVKIQESFIETLDNLSRYYSDGEQMRKAQREKSESTTKRDLNRDQLRRYITEYNDQNKIVAKYLGVKLETEPEMQK